MVSRMRYLFILLLGWSLSAHALTSLTARIDRNPVVANESFTLTVEADDSVSRNAIDFSPLMKHFAVGSTRMSSEVRVINSDMQRLMRWQTSLTATKPGTYTIPAFHIGQVSTQPITVKVVAPADADNQHATQHSPVFLRANVDTKHPYPDQQVQLQLAIYFKYPLQRGSLDNPTVEHADINQLGDDQHSTTVLDGVRYQVITRRYAVYPQQAGSITLPAIKFDGTVVVKDSRFLFDQGVARHVEAQSSPITLQVRPIPDNAPRPWLPAHHLQVEQSWEPTSDTIKIGDPITRKIQLKAVGTSPDAIPDLVGDYPDTVNVYPDKVQTDQNEDNGEQTTLASQSMTLLPQQPGKLSLPARTIQWWDVDKDEPATVTLPGYSVDVTDANGVVPKASPTQTPPATRAAPSTPPTKAVEKQHTAATINHAEHAKAPASHSLTYWLTWLFAALWLITLIALLFYYRYRRASQTNAKANKHGAQSPEKQLAAACQHNDTKAIYQALAQLARGYYPECAATGLAMDKWQHAAPQELAVAISKLQQLRYRSATDQQSEWTSADSEQLLKAVKAFQQQQQTAQQGSASPLPKLYPED